jgi:hypothetical protein
LIYFIRSSNGPIKIGTTIRLSTRLKQLVAEHGEGLEVLAVTEGSYEAESELHRRFSHLRVVNEWFEPGDDLMGFIIAEARPWDGIDEASEVRTILTIKGSPEWLAWIDDLRDVMRRAKDWHRIDRTDVVDAGLRLLAERYGMPSPPDRY